MATSEYFEIALAEALSSLSHDRPFILKQEQNDSIRQLVCGGDLLAVLPTGFGKSLIFQLLIHVTEIMTKKKACAVVVCPLQSIVNDQILEASSMGLTARLLKDLNLEQIEQCDYQLLFGSAEEVLSKRFLTSIKKQNTPLNQNLAAIIIDESHTVETWTGKRTTKRGTSSSTIAFREAFAELSTLRSCCRTGTPVEALTGTADEHTQATIKSLLCMRPDAVSIYVSPNRKNLRFTVKKTKKRNQLQQLNWLVTLLKENGKDATKTIIFCNTMVEIATVLNYLMGQLGNFAYYPPHCKSPDTCLVAIYHSHSWESNKKRVVDSFKGNGLIRVVVATTALCMGVNFPDIHYIINWGPARTILDQHQEAGRAGRDGVTSHIIVLYHGQQVGPCEQAVKEFVHAEGCLRVAAYQSLDSTIQPILPSHDCCSHCKTKCMCKGNMCDAPLLPFEKDYVVDKNYTGDATNSRTVTSKDRKDLKCALMEVLNHTRAEAISLDETFSHGFSMQLIEDVVERCGTIFSIEDITMNFPVFSVVNAQKILEVIQEIFLDITYFDETTELLDIEQAPESHFNWWEFEENLTFDDGSESE